MKPLSLSALAAHIEKAHFVHDASRSAGSWVARKEARAFRDAVRPLQVSAKLSDETNRLSIEVADYSIPLFVNFFVEDDDGNGDLVLGGSAQASDLWTGEPLVLEAADVEALSFTWRVEDAFERAAEDGTLGQLAAEQKGDFTNMDGLCRECRSRRAQKKRVQ